MKNEDIDLPIGFAMALAQNSPAMKNFAKLTDKQRQDYANHAKQINSRDEMQELVSRIGSGNAFKM